MIDREAAIHFRDAPTRDRIMADLSTPLIDSCLALSCVPGAFKPGVRRKCDCLAVDEHGRLLAVEVKPRGVSSIMWSPAQATVYARLFERWLVAKDLPSQPVEILRDMADQRRSLGLFRGRSPHLSDVPTVVPVVAVQRGAGVSHLDGLRRVQEHLLAAGVGNPNLEVYEVNLAGRMTRLEL